MAYNLLGRRLASMDLATLDALAFDLRAYFIAPSSIGSPMRMGEFESSPARAPMSEINVTPLVDVMLVLLVIFLITAPADGWRIAHLDLPSTDATSVPSTQPQPEPED